ncbi:energy-coupling factor transporter transmembrane protein EcfT [bacterium]|nr:energy-coupling factor transporter transmembrane protein EcfT [bacterium]MBU1983391.1 energy-coupling factor transporter transmembrane protein EcfT [bacterium]
MSLVLISRAEGLTLLAGIWLLAIVTMRVSVWNVTRGVLRLWPFLLLTGLFHVFLSGHDSVGLAEFPRIGITSESILAAVFFTLRLAFILSVTVVLFDLHSPQQYGKAVGRLLGRMKLGRSALTQTELVVTLALRFVPFLEQEYRRIRLAHAARGLDRMGGRVARLRQVRTVLFSLLMTAFRRADHVTFALEARGYDPRIVRTALHTHPVMPAELIVTVIFVLTCAIAPWM